MMIDFLNEDEFTMTQIHTEIDKAKELYHTLGGSIYSAVLYDEIRWAYRLLSRRESAMTRSVSTACLKNYEYDRRLSYRILEVLIFQNE